jgi:hypothetical protein
MSTCASVTDLTRPRPDQQPHPWTLPAICRLYRLVAAILLAAATVLVSAGTAQALGQSKQSTCDAKVFCAWSGENYLGASIRTDSHSANHDECVPLPGGLEASSFINRLKRPVTAYEDAGCSLQAAFNTYPGGAFVPRSPHVVRAITIWSHASRHADLRDVSGPASASAPAIARPTDSR